MSKNREPDTFSDAALRELLREASPTPPLDAVAWETLHRRVMDDARQVLARAPIVRPWWEVVAGWASRGVPITAAAAAAAAVVLALVGPSARDVGTPTVAVTLEQALAGDAAPLLTGEAEDVLTRALLDDGEEW